MNVKLKQQTTGLIKEVKIGFSWTCLFFGGFVPLFRLDWLWLFLYIIFCSITFGLFWVIFPFIYNRIYIKNLIEKRGYVPSDEIASNILVQKGYIAPSTAFGSNRQMANPIIDGGPFISPQTTFQTDQDGVGSATGSSLSEVVKNVFKKRTCYKKSYNSEKFKNLTPKELEVIAKKFPPFIASKESVLYAGLFSFGSSKIGGFAFCGVIITENNLYYRLCNGFMSRIKSGSIPLRAINSIKAEYANAHACYGGGNPGPEITVNGTCIGWMQLLGTVPDEDAELLYEVVTQINSSGCLLALR
jgi:hypothetical protein